MLGLITDRTQENVERCNLLTQKGWAAMTAAERVEWSGDPFGTQANLFTTGKQVPAGVNLEYQSDAILATAYWDGTYLYSASIVGAAANYEGKTFTLSVDSVSTVGGGTPIIAAYWWGDDGSIEYAGGSLSGAGSVTFTTSENTGGRPYLAFLVYVTQDVSVTAGAMVKYWGVMLNEGTARQPYVPYTAILPTPATKGAYNYSDLNRVELAVAEIAKAFGLTLETKTDWGPWDVPVQSDMARYLANVNTIRNMCPNKDSLPELPASLYSMTYTTANAIETILEAAADYAQQSYRCGEIIC